MITEIDQSDVEITLIVERDEDELTVSLFDDQALPSGLADAIQTWCESAGGGAYAERKYQHWRDRDDGGADERYHRDVDEGRA